MFSRDIARAKAPHLRAAPTGTARDAVRAAAHVAAAIGRSERVEASPTHHPGSGAFSTVGASRWTWGPGGWAAIAEDTAVPEEERARARAALSNLARKPVDTAFDDGYIVNERKGVTAGAEPPGARRAAAPPERYMGLLDAPRAATLEAHRAATYHNKPFRGAMRRAASMG